MYKYFTTILQQVATVKKWHDYTRITQTIKDKKRNPTNSGESLIIHGARGENRTRTTIRSRDFKSLASTSSATRADERQCTLLTGFCQLSREGVLM